MMLYPAMNKLTEYVPNRYMMVNVVARRARQIAIEAEVQGAIQVCAKRPETVRIFMAPPSWEELERRLTARGTDAPEKIQKRLQRAKIEMETAADYDYFVINDDVAHAVAELDAILCAEHCRPAERMGQIV